MIDIQKLKEARKLIGETITGNLDLKGQLVFDNLIDSAILLDYTILTLEGKSEDIIIKEVKYHALQEREVK